MTDPEFSAALRRFLLAAAAAYRAHGSATGDGLADAVRGHAARDAAADPTAVPACHAIGDVLAAGDWRDDAVRQAAAPVLGRLRWTNRVGPIVGGGFGDRYGAAEIVGPTGLIGAPDVRFGLFLMVPDTDYPPHSHAAEELYLVLSGTADWAVGDAPFKPIAPGGFSHHLPWDAHATRTGAAPLLALWGWTGDLDFTTYRMNTAVR